MQPKTFAIITDIHSNLASLTKALSIIDERKGIDQIVCLGDCFALGPEPEKTLEILKTIQDCIFIRGNHDRYLLEELWKDELPSLEGMDPYDPICQAIVENEKWTADLLGQEGRDFCGSMQIAHREIIGNTLVEFTHAWYKRDDKPPSATEALKWRDRVLESNPEVEKVIFIHGHVHVPRHQIIENLTILCQGATGLPFDRDQRGSVAFLTVDNNEVKWDVDRYDYDMEITTDQLEKRKPPFYINLKNTIKFASIRNDL
jgi:predicted phosphodiesterase